MKACLCTSALDGDRKLVFVLWCKFVRAPSGEEDGQANKQLNWKSASLWQTRTSPSLLFEGKQVVNLGCQPGQKKEAGDMVWRASLAVKKDHQQGLWVAQLFSKAAVGGDKSIRRNGLGCRGQKMGKEDSS